MARYGSLDYPRLTKRGFLLGLFLFVIGVVGEFVGHTVIGGLPGWEQTLLFDLEVLGILIALMTPLLFGVILPLTE